MPELTKATRKLIREYQSVYWHMQPREGVVTIGVDEIASKVATFYEKVRELVDWKESHLMRRVAIQRILKRRLFLRKGEGVAERFIMELIRGGHFPNNRIEKSKIKKVQKVIDKYTFILENNPSSRKDKAKASLYSRFVEIAACEVEETLDPASHLKINALIEYMETLMREKIKIGKKAKSITGITDEEKDVQIYIAVQKALFKLDSPIIAYNLLKRKYFDWLNLQPESLADIAKNICSVWEDMNRTLAHPLAGKFYNVCERYDTPCLLLGDIVLEDPMGIEEKIVQSDSFREMIKKAYAHRLKTLRSRLSRAAFYSTASIFLTKILTLYVVEIPFAKIISGEFNRWSMAANVLAPTLLMFLLVITIRLPGKENLDLVIAEAEKNAYENEKEDSYPIELYRPRGFVMRTIISFIYFASFCLCFGAMIWVLYRLNFPPFSYLVFLVFIPLIVFTGTKIRQRARELHITAEKETFLHFLTDPFVIPVIRVGRWLAIRWEKYNIITVFLNFMIDTPFLIFVEFLEQWRYFLKEKKGEIS